MILTLEITGPHAAALGAACRKVFRSAGGTIGRLPENHWALPDPYVSSRHALIRYRDGVFSIEDTSTNGTFVNSPDQRLAKGVAHPLASGDWIFIEPYEIKASLTSEAKDASSASPFGDPFALPPAAARPRPGSIDPHRGDELIASGEEVDPLALLDLISGGAPSSAPRAADLARGSVLSEPYRPPALQPDPRLADAGPEGLIPDDWLNPAERSSVGSRPASPARREVPSAQDRPTPRKSVSGKPPSPGRESDLADVLAGAGLEGVAVTPELSRNFGRILRVVVGGLMDVLQARQKIKNEFRIDMTTFKPADNNPLKFSANVDDALHNLLVKRNAAFLAPVEAFEDAFDDVRHHQVAMLEGVRVAFAAMLAEFDPDHLQQEFDRRSKGALLSAPAKLRYWDQYRAKIHDMVGDADRTFRELFGNEFANAYEKQLKRLRAQSRKP